MLRFGFSEYRYADANGSLADFAGFVGLPVVGLTFLKRINGIEMNLDDMMMVFCFASIEAITRGVHAQKRNLSKILMNLAFFVTPVALYSIQNQKTVSLIGIILFVFAGLVVTADRHRTIMGVRCENWFHYLIAVAAFLISQGL